MLIKFYWTEERKKPIYQIGHLVRKTELLKKISKGDTTNWYYKFLEITNFIKYTILTNRIGTLPEGSAEKSQSPRERCNEALLKET